MPLVKECGCIIHDGPHWLHMNAILRKINADWLENAVQRGGWTYQLLAGYAIRESDRLRELRWSMERNHVEEIPPEYRIEWRDVEVVAWGIATGEFEIIRGNVYPVKKEK